MLCGSAGKSMIVAAVVVEVEVAEQIADRRALIGNKDLRSP